MFKASKHRKRQAQNPRHKGSATSRTKRDRAKNSMNWSNAFLLKVADKAAKSWQRGLAIERARQAT